MPTRTAMAETARARSHVYEFLATLFRAEPTSALLRELKDPGVAAIFSELDFGPGSEFFQRPEEKLLEDLAVEYARLFLGPAGHISPHESVHHEIDGGGWGELWGEETVRVKNFIETAGLRYASDYSGIPDHISVELEFLQRLCIAEAASWAEGNSREALLSLEVANRFMEEHVIKWVPVFCDKVIENATLTFYREVAVLTKSFLEFDRIQIRSALLPRNQPSD